MIGLVSLCLVACSNDPQVVTETQVIIVKPPAISPCERFTIKACAPATNGELYECSIEAVKKLWLCADQTDALIEWSKQADGQRK